MGVSEIIARRTDLSSFLVHLTRDTAEKSAKSRLTEILQSQRLLAMSPFGSAYEKLKNANLSVDSQKCVCFTETPLEHVNLLTEKIEGRQCQFDRTHPPHLAYPCGYNRS